MPKHHKPPSTAIDIQHPTVLVVDDNTLVRKLVITILENEGFKVISASGPTTALALVSSLSSPPDLMICDICMPVMTGPELCQQVAQRFPEMPILFISGYPGEYLRDDNTLVREDNLLRKPFRSAQLLGRVATMLNTQRTGANTSDTFRSAGY